MRLAQEKTGQHIIMLEAPTGTGKSAIATAVGHHVPVTVVAGTLALLDQYRDNYGFAVIKGKQEYLCSNTEYIKKWGREGFRGMPTAADCPFGRMTDCPFVGECRYVAAKTVGKRSRKLALTYSYATRAPWIVEREGVLVLDEAHESVEWMLASGEDALTKRSMRDTGVPWPPPIDAKFDGPIYGEQLDKLANWVTKAVLNLEADLEDIPDTDTDEMTARGRMLKTYGRLSRLKWRLNTMPYHVRIEDNRENELEINFMPLKAQSEMFRLSKDRRLVLLMSATIGDPRPLALELGVQTAETAVLGHPVPKEFRPIVDLGFDKRVTWANIQAEPGLLERQAHVIAEWVSMQDMRNRGLVLAPSRAKIQALEDVMFRELPQYRRLISQGRTRSISDVVREFTQDKRPGDVAIMTIQGAGTGLDLRGDLARFVVVAGADYSNPSDTYVASRKAMGCGDYYWWRSYLGVVQAAGRVSRGEKDENGGWLKNWAVVADPGLLTPKARAWYPPWFNEAIVPAEQNQ
jgi:Rad3-related DNA helicase